MAARRGSMTTIDSEPTTMIRNITAFLIAVASFASAAQEAPDALIRRVSEEVLEIVRADKDIQNGQSAKAIALVDAKVIPHFNFAHMTALAVGKDWRKATPAQQQQLTAEFKTLLVRTYSNSLTNYRDQKIIYKPFKMSPEDRDVVVRVEVQQPGHKAVQIDYNLEKRDTGWKVFDVSVAGISLVTNYREQFAQEVRNGGVDGLIASLVAKNKALEGSLAKAPAK
jgi:phospholipid transport system substrate-binding protein